MKDIEYINKNLFIKSVERAKRTKVFVNHDGKEILLADVKKIAENFWIRTVYDENYIVVYSRGDMSNQIPLFIEAAYNIKNKSIVNLSGKIRVLLEYMLIHKKGIDIAAILEYINDCPLGIAEEDEKEDLVRYLTSGNTEISREEIIKYILNNYPELHEHMNYTNKLSVIEYRNILDEFDDDYLRFHVIPQIIDLSPVEKKRLESIDELDEATREVEQELGYSKNRSIKVKARKK